MVVDDPMDNHVDANKVVLNLSINPKCQFDAVIVKDQAIIEAAEDPPIGLDRSINKKDSSEN